MAPYLKWILILGSAVTPAFGAEFLGLTELPSGTATLFSSGMDVSTDGSTIVGYALMPSSDIEAARWTASEGWVPLGDLGAPTTVAIATNADGSVIVGFGLSSVQEAFRWTSDSGIVGLGTLPGATHSIAMAVSADGSVVVGSSDRRAFRWTHSEGMVSLGDGSAFDISADGAVIAGRLDLPGSFVPARWTEAEGLVPLSGTEGRTGGATAISADGMVIVGSFELGTLFPTTEAFLWTEAGGVVLLHSALDGVESSSASDISADGSSVVGSRRLSGQTEAFLWNKQHGAQSIASLLEGDGVGLGTWHLTAAYGISGDGSVVTGLGIDPNGRGQAWIAKFGKGLLGTSVLTDSLHSIAGAGQAAQQTASENLDIMLDVARHYGSASAPGEISVWGGLSGGSYDVLQIDPYTVSGRFGARYQATSALSLGAGVQLGDRTAKLGAYDGEIHSQPFGADLFAVYRPAFLSHLRVSGAISAARTNDKIKRGYLNGADATFSQGTREGVSYGAAAAVEWELSLGAGLTVLPFASYSASHIELDDYTETNGPFPAHFGAVSETLQISRVGGEVQQTLTDGLDIWASADWAHRFSDHIPALSGEIPVLSLPFATPGAPVRADWAEGNLGFNWRASKHASMYARVGASSDGDTAPHYSAGLGAVVSF